MTQHLVVPADDIVEQILVQCWMFEARAGQRDVARARAERTLERLLARGLPRGAGANGSLLLDPYDANNALKSRAGEPADESWPDWRTTTRRNAASLPEEPHRYRLAMRREWHAFAQAAGRPLVFRLPAPLRGAVTGPATVRLLEPSGALIDRRDGAGRVELRVDAAKVNGPVVAEMEVDFEGGELRDPGVAAAVLGAPVPEEALWLRDREGLAVQSSAVAMLAAELAQGQETARDLAHRAWDWLIGNLRFGDVHREVLDPSDPMGSVLRGGLADCVLGSSLLVALCRARGVPARLLSGYLLHPANVGPHTWAEVRLAPGRWVPFDFGSWCYCAGDPADPIWGRYFRGRVDARFVAEVAPREFTGWGSAPPPERWFRLERLRGDRIEHTLHALPDGALVRRDQVSVEIVGAAGTRA